MRELSRDGLTFRFPEAWKVVEEEAAEAGWTLTLQTPGDAFALIRLDRTLPEPGEMLEEALAGLRSEYRDIDVETALETIAGDVAVGHDVEFLSLDLPVSCWTRSFHGPAGTVLVYCQVSDADREEHEPALRNLTASMILDD